MKAAKAEEGHAVGAGLPSVLGLSKIESPAKRVRSGRLVGHRPTSAKIFDTEKPIPAADLKDMRAAGILTPEKYRRQKASAKSRQPRPNIAGQPTRHQA